MSKLPPKGMRCSRTDLCFKLENGEIKKKEREKELADIHLMRFGSDDLFTPLLFLKPYMGASEWIPFQTEYLRGPFILYGGTSHCLSTGVQ